MVIDLRNLDEKTEEKLRKYLKKDVGYIKRGSLSKTVEEAIEFYLENPDLLNQWRKNKKIKKTLKASTIF